MTKTKLVATPKEFFQLLQANRGVVHSRAGKTLSGGGLTAAAEFALLMVKTELATVNEPLQLFQVENVIAQLVLQAAMGGSIVLGLGMIMVLAAAGSVVVVGVAVLPVKRRSLSFFQPAQATPLNFAAHEDELFEHEVAALRVQEQTPGCEELTPGLVERLNELLEVGRGIAGTGRRDRVRL